MMRIREQRLDGRFLDDLTRINPQLKIIGLTATPYRLDSGMLHTGPDALCKVKSAAVSRSWRGSEA